MDQSGRGALRRLRIVLLDDHQRAAERFLPLDEIRQVCEPEVTTYHDTAPNADALLERIADAEVVVAMRERSPLPAEVIDRLRATELIVTTGARNAAIDVDAARRRGIVVSGTRGKSPAPAELTWGLLLALVRRIPQEHEALRQGRWGVHLGDTLDGKLLGIVGFGSIGARVARYGQAFGMRVLAHSRSLTRELAATAGVEAVSADTLLREADVVSLHLTLTPETRGFLGERELGLMQRSAVLINTARGGLVDEPALVRALQERRIAGAGLDVFATEPLPPDSPLLTLDNVVLTPHIGYVTEAKYGDYYRQVAEIIAAHARGERLRELA